MSPGPPRVGAIVLAAGGSSRMGAVNKLLEPLDGAPLVARVVDALLAAGVQPVVVVTGHAAAAVEGALADRPIEVVANPRWAEGMSTSLAAGVPALGGRVDGAFVSLGDMPLVTPEDLRALVRAFTSEKRDRTLAACIPVHEGRRGNPVLWSAEWFPELARLSGDRGARALLTGLEDRVAEVPAGEGVLLDADTPDALERLRVARRPG